MASNDPFAAALLSPLPFLQQSGFAIAAGVLIDTFVVRTLLVPAAAHPPRPLRLWPSGTPDQAPSTRRRSVVLAGVGIAALTAGLLLVAATRPTPDPFHRVAATPTSAAQNRP